MGTGTTPFTLHAEQRASIRRQVASLPPAGVV
jgi:hypothetical protein